MPKPQVRVTAEKRAGCEVFDPGMTDVKVELADQCPPMGISIDVTTGRRNTLDKTGKSSSDVQVQHPPMACRPDCPNTGDPHALGGLRISRTEL